jgi:carbonic anhydrase
MDRRALLAGIGASGLIAALPFPAQSASGKYESMLLSCIDPRFPELTLDYMKDRGLLGQYSQFAIAGAAIAVVAPAFKDWRKAFWGNLAATIELHHINKVTAIDHRDCGAAKIAYGDAALATAQAETQTHRAALMQFRNEVQARHPKLAVETGPMALDGKVEMLG